jgi:zinc transport system substrate-binding protein
VRPTSSTLPALLGLLLVFAIPRHHAVAAPRVVASIAPLHSLVAAVMADAGTPSLLLRGGESPHTFSLRPSDAQMLNDADILFWIGPALELPLARILPNLGVSRNVALLDAPGLTVLPSRHLHPVEPHKQNPRRASAGADSGIDPHIWLSTKNAATMVDEITRRLAELDPAQAALYRSNAALLRRQLRALDEELAARFSVIRGNYAVFHDAYQYFERDHSLSPVAIMTTHPERSPGAASLREFRATLVDQEVDCIFSEPQFQPRLVTMLSEGLPVRHAVLDPLGAEIPPGPKAYLQMMRSMADALTDCIRGDTR